jgi:outer membrane protein TolC
MLKSLFTLGLMGLTLLAPAAAWAEGVLPGEPLGFTLAVAVNQAMRYNPDIQIAEARLKQAEIEKQAQDLWWARSINANANYLVGNQYGTVTQQGINTLPSAALGMGVNLGDLLIGPKNSAKASQDVVIAQADLRRVTLKIAADVTTAFQAYESAKQIDAYSGSTISAAESDVKIAEREFSNGQSPVNMLLGARLAVARAHADQIQVAGNVAGTWTNLLCLMGGTNWPAATAQTDNGR